MSTLYIPSHFAETRVEVIHDFLRANPFCSLVTLGTDGFIATHLPLLLDASSGAQGVLRGHIARANHQHQAGGVQALAIFQGAEAYISPSFYPSKRQHGRVVPTWNYSVVHVSGTVRFVDDPSFVAQNVEDLTSLMEGGRDRPWKVSDAPADYLEKLTRAIIGVELDIHDLKAKFKLSQNRDAADFLGVVDGLGRSSDAGDREVSTMMQSLPRAVTLKS